LTGLEGGPRITEDPLVEKEDSMKKTLNVPAVILAAGLTFAAASGLSPQEIRTKPIGIPHEMADVLKAACGKVEIDLTTKEIVVTNTQREGSLYLRLFKDYERVMGKTFVYKDPLRFPLDEGAVYAVWISSDNGFGTATFQFSRGKLHIERRD
jgi:hypothetical protein